MALWAAATFAGVRQPSPCLTLRRPRVASGRAGDFLALTFAPSPVWTALRRALHVQRTLCHQTSLGNFQLRGLLSACTLGRTPAPALPATVCTSAGVLGTRAPSLGSRGPVPRKAGRQGTPRQQPYALFSGARTEAFSFELREHQARQRSPARPVLSRRPRGWGEGESLGAVGGAGRLVAWLWSQAWGAPQRSSRSAPTTGTGRPEHRPVSLQTIFFLFFPGRPSLSPSRPQLGVLCAFRVRPGRV